MTNPHKGAMKIANRVLILYENVYRLANRKLLLVRCITHGNQTTGRNETVSKRQLRNNVITTNNGLVKCRARESCAGVITIFNKISMRN